ncbi:MAG: PEP-CTERM sorting domain-containing protein [Thermoguttaceae bacterium]
MKSRFTPILAVLVLFLLCPFVLTAAEYNIGAGGDYTDLESLRLAGVLQSGDTILLPSDDFTSYWGDSSLQGTFSFTGDTNLTVRSRDGAKGSVSLVQPFPFIYSGRNLELTVDTIGFYNGFAENGGVLRINGALTLNGTSSFGGNRAQINGGAVDSLYVTISGGDHQFWGNTALENGGAIAAREEMRLLGGTNRFEDNKACLGGAIHSLYSVDIQEGSNVFWNNEAYYGGAVAGGDVRLVGGRNIFEQNKASDSGGAIAGERDIVLSGGHNAFKGNSAYWNGGALVTYATVLIEGGENSFYDNFAGLGFGGAIAAQEDVIFSGGENVFIGNVAGGWIEEGKGGAVCALGDVRVLDGRNEFTGNLASHSGGAIASEGMVLIEGGTNEFRDNIALTRGGAISAEKSVVISGGENSFYHNFILDDSTVHDAGGAIAALENIQISGGTNTFDGNSSYLWFGWGNGGALDAKQGSVVISDGNNTFTNNLAGNCGGAISAAKFSLEGGVNVFDSNNGWRGGAAYGSVTTTLSGGTNTFTNNEARDNGGAIYGGYTSLEGGTNYFSGNRASLGGAIKSWSTLSISGGTNTFHGNQALWETLLNGEVPQGGAIFAAVVTLEGGTNDFYINYAGFGGGAIGASLGVGISGGENTFGWNGANQYGGAIYSGVIQIDGGKNHFEGNAASVYGGALKAYDTVNINGGENTFVDNVANDKGGAIYAEEAVNISGGTNTFEGNSAEQGGAIYAPNVTIRAKAGDGNGDVTFKNNSDGRTANAVYVSQGTDNNPSTLNIAAEEGRSVNFYDPIKTASAQAVPNDFPNNLVRLGNFNSVQRYELIVKINEEATDMGTVVFDGSLYSHSDDRTSVIGGDTYVGHGTFALKGAVTYQNEGYFLLDETATLSTDGFVNTIIANGLPNSSLTERYPAFKAGHILAGTVDFTDVGGTLNLIGDTALAGTVNMTLGQFGSGLFHVEGDLFIRNSVLNLTLADDGFDWNQDWMQSWDVMSASGGVYETDIYGAAILGWDTLLVNFNYDSTLYKGLFVTTFENGVFSAVYTAEVPEPGTLLLLGIAAIAVPFARRRRK